MRLLTLLVAGLLLLGSAGPTAAQPASPSDTTMQDRRPVPDPITPSPRFQQAVEQGTRTESGAPGPNYWTNTTEYTLDATIDPTSQILRGQGTIRYQNNSPDTLRQLALHLRQNIHKEGAMRNRTAEVTGGMTLDSLKLAGSSLRRAASPRQLQRQGQGYLVQDTRLLIAPPTPLPPDESTTVEVGWHFQIPGAENFRMGQDGEVYFIGYWYPHMVVYNDVHGWRAQPYQGDGEFYMGYGDYDVSITVPEGWLVGATGTLQNPEAVLTDSVHARLRRARQADTTVAVVDSPERGTGTATVESMSDSTLTWTYAAEQVRDVAFGT